MIRIEFDPARIPGSLLLRVEDLNSPRDLLTKLQESQDPLSQHLVSQFSPQTKQLTTEYDKSEQPTPALLAAVVDELNRQLQGASLFARQRFTGIEFERDTLIRMLISHDPQGDDLLRLNRLLLEEAYADLVAKSPRVEWDAWTFLAREATERVIAKWEQWVLEVEEWQKTKEGTSPEFNPAWEADVWKGIRDFLSKYVFHHKCAYCETREVGYIADAEHFRPKGQVRSKSGIVKTFDVDGKSEIAHPGYFWLAYRWENLLPSCNTCNRYGGKKDLFPVENAHIAVKRITDPNEVRNLRHQIRQSQKINGIFYLEPDDLDVFEKRLLLHPYFDRPEEHLYFRVDGKAAARPGSKRGEASIEVFHLNEPNKVAERNRVQADGAALYLTKVTAAIPDPVKMKTVAQEISNEYFNGDRPYAAAVFANIEHFTGGSLISPEALLKDAKNEGEN